MCHHVAILLVALSGTLMLFGPRALDGAPETARQPVPDEAALQQAHQLIREVYGKEYEQAKTPERKTALARKLLAEAVKTKAEPASHFALLRVAREIAIAAGDAGTALEAVGRVASAYDLDALGMKVEAVEGAGKAARTSAQLKTVAREAFALVDEAVAADEYDRANRSGRLARDAARRGRDYELARRAAERLNEVKAAQQQYQAVAQAREVLRKSPADPEANLTAGRYLCLVKGDWDKGGPMLALGSDPALKVLAIKELKSPGTTDAQVELGDGWWDVAQTKEGREKESLLLRAGAWYSEAQAELPTGLLRVRLEKRLKEIAAIVGIPNADSTPVGEVRQFGPADGGVGDLAVSPDGRLVMAGFHGGHAAIWRIDTGREVFRRRFGARVYCVAFSPDGRLAAAGSTDPRIRLIDLKKLDVVREIPTGNGVMCMVFSADGQRMYAGSETPVPFRIWDVQSGRALAQIQTAGSNIRAACLSPDGRFVLGAYTNGSLGYCESQQGKLLRSIKAHDGLFYACAFLPDGRHVATGGSEKAVRLWDLATGRLLRQFEGNEGEVTGLSVSSDGRWLLSSAKDGSVRLWNVSRGRQMGVWKHDGHATRVAFLPDPRFAVSGASDGVVRLWKLPISRSRSGRPAR